ncbi:putative NACHT domain-containing protein [Seiridium unicorne]|uniref:NACHT domain-containing protein n=1 Tax=Seiridium unicorne TaxID=138068 RepID=A0ABR2V9V2_9PEZI
MTSRNDYSIGWVCALSIEVTAAKAALDHIHNKPPPDHKFEKDDGGNNYIFGDLEGHNVIVAYSELGAYGETSVADVVARLHASFPSVRSTLIVGIARGVPNTAEDVRLGDVVVSKSTGGLPGVVQYDANWALTQDVASTTPAKVPDQPTSSLLTAIGKVETAAIFNDSKTVRYISEMVRRDPATFSRPSPEQDRCPDGIELGILRDPSCSVVHYGLIASGPQLIHDGAARDGLTRRQGILCVDTEIAGLKNAAQYLVIRGICDYLDSHSSEIWYAYAAVAAAAYAKEVLSIIPVVATKRPKTVATANPYAEAAPVLDALLLTRPEVDRKSLIALNGRRVDGTCEWLVKHPRYREWLTDAGPPLLWISGGPGKGKSMLAIYTTEILQPTVDAEGNVLLYYFCSNRDKNRNSAVTIMRSIIHQWVSVQPYVAQYVKTSFEGSETTKYTVSGFLPLWRLFVVLLRKTKSSQIVCVLDGLDECEKETLGQLLDAVGDNLSQPKGEGEPRLKLIVFSRPKPAILDTKLGRYLQIKLDEADLDVAHDVNTYIVAKVAEISSEQGLSKEMATQVQQALLAGADDTFLWVGFVANELEGRNWDQIQEILHSVPKSLGGVYQRLLQQLDDKEQLIPILQWVILAARPLTMQELTVAAGIQPSGSLSTIEVTRARLRQCGLLVKIEAGVVNLVHESVKEFFQSDQVNIHGIDMFHMNRNTHRALMRTCLAHVERGYGTSSKVQGTAPSQDPLLQYASLYWPVHFQHAMDVIDARSDFSRTFFHGSSPIRNKWWKFYWEHDKNGGNPPSFTLLHLAAYLGNVLWAKMLISKHARLVSRKDNYGRTPLQWAVSQDHLEMVQLLIDSGAPVNGKDRGSQTALHVAVTGQNKDVVMILLDHGAKLELMTEHGDTPLIRAIQAHSKELIQILLEHGAQVDKLPTPPGVIALCGPSTPMEERITKLLELERHIFSVRYEKASRKNDFVMKGLRLATRFPIILQVMGRYLNFVALNRWEHFFVLQELVRGNKMNELRPWADEYSEFFLQLVQNRNHKGLKAILEVSIRILREVAPGDLFALLVIIIIVGATTKLAAIRSGFREGDAIVGWAFTQYADVASERDAKEALHLGLRKVLGDFDACIQSDMWEETLAWATLFVTQHLSMIELGSPQLTDYLGTVIAEFYQGYIDGVHETELFGVLNQAWASEFSVISKHRDSTRLRLLLTAIFNLAAQSSGAKPTIAIRAQEHFLDIIPASCLILCQGKDGATAHQWLIGEAITEEMIVRIAKQSPGPLQKLANKAFIECLIIGKQYGLASPRAAQARQLKLHLPEVESMARRIVGS